METRELKIVRGKSGGTGVGYTYRLTIPTVWIKKMGLGGEKRQVKCTFEDNKLVIERAEC